MLKHWYQNFYNVYIVNAVESMPSDMAADNPKLDMLIKILLEKNKLKRNGEY